MSVALIIRNINPDCDQNTQLVVVALDEHTAATPVRAAEAGLAPYPNAATSLNPQGQVYWFPPTTPVQDSMVLLHGEDSLCTTADSNEPDYLWFCELDQAG